MIATHHRQGILNQAVPHYKPSIRKVWPWPTILLERAAEWITALPGDIWLDAACGEGPLAGLIGKRKQLVGLDIDFLCLQRAQNHPFSWVAQASVTDLPFADASLDGIVSIETLEHVEEMSSALKEFARCIKPNGYLLVTMPSVTLRSWWDMHRTRQPVYCSEEQHVRELTAIPIHGLKHRFQTFRWLENELAGAGFSVKRRSGVGFLFPMWRRRFSFLEHGMNALYREAVNKIFGNIPGLRLFPYYRMVLSRLEVPRELP
jgi:2-polyprenyl-3-methyl-5-hydroxy-6-metoxy-1,4-benzoquinol methylase